MTPPCVPTGVSCEGPLWPSPALLHCVSPRMAVKSPSFCWGTGPAHHRLSYYGTQPSQASTQKDPSLGFSPPYSGSSLSGSLSLPWCPDSLSWLCPAVFSLLPVRWPAAQLAAQALLPGAVGLSLGPLAMLTMLGHVPGPDTVGAAAQRPWKGPAEAPCPLPPLSSVGMVRRHKLLQ